MLNSKDGFFGKRDEKVRKDVSNIYGMSSSSTSPASSSGVGSSTASSPAPAPGAGSTSSATQASTEAGRKLEGQGAAPAEEGKGNKLIVGPDIKLKGEINDCDTIIVEGRVEATTDSRVLQIAESGAYAGTVGIDVAEIRGRFQGELTARHKLVIYSTGSVTGKIRYGKIVIEEGGELNGDVSSLAASKAGAGVTPAKGSDSPDAKGSDYWHEQEAKKAAGGKAASA